MRIGIIGLGRAGTVHLDAWRLVEGSADPSLRVAISSVTPAAAAAHIHPTAIVQARPPASAVNAATRRIPTNC